MNIVKAHQLLGQRFLARNGEKGWATLGRAECTKQGGSRGGDFWGFRQGLHTHTLPRPLFSLCAGLNQPWWGAPVAENPPHTKRLMEPRAHRDRPLQD